MRSPIAISHFKNNFLWNFKLYLHIFVVHEHTIRHYQYILKTELYSFLMSVNQFYFIFVSSIFWYILMFLQHKIHIPTLDFAVILEIISL